MGLWDRLKKELIDIVEWIDDSSDTMVHRFERFQNEIKNGAKLVVREGQAAVFIKEGKLADVMTPGSYTLDTNNVPILATLLGWKYGFESPFKCEVYFVSTRRFSNLKWGTKNPIMLRDPEFGPVRIRAFGTYEVRVGDPGKFIQEVCGTEGTITTDEVHERLRNLIIPKFTDLVGESKIPVLDLAANYNELGDFIRQHMHDEFAEAYGLDVTKMVVENISLPPAVEEALDKRTSMGVIGNLGAYTQFQAANAMEAAAENPHGGGAAEGMGLGMGFAMAGQMANAMNPQQQQQAPPAGGAVPPPLPVALAFFAAINGQQAGPFEIGVLQEKVSIGELSRDTLVWKQGMAAWIKAGEVAELASLFANTPPPLPPTA
jgi:membrane protease subunit (stomatin/prohibitin family)